MRVGYEFREIEPSLLDHPIGIDVLEAVFVLHVKKSEVNGLWWCSIRVGFNGLPTFRGLFGFLWWLLG